MDVVFGQSGRFVGSAKGLAITLVNPRRIAPPAPAAKLVTAMLPVRAAIAAPPIQNFIKFAISLSRFYVRRDYSDFI